MPFSFREYLNCYESIFVRRRPLFNRQNGRLEEYMKVCGLPEECMFGRAILAKIYGDEKLLWKWLLNMGN